MSLAILTMALVGLALWTTPFWFRKDVQFGVTVAQALPRDAVKQARKKWLLAEAAVLLGGAALFCIWLGTGERGIEWPLAQLVYVVFALAAWAAGWTWAHLRLLHERNRAGSVPTAPSGPREASLRPRRFSEHYSLGAALCAALILIGWCVWLAHVYPELPARIAVHFGGNGQPDGWSSRSFDGVFFLPGLGVVVWAVLDLIAFMIIHGRIVTYSGPAGEAETAYRRSVLMFLQWMKPVMILFLAWIQVATMLPETGGRPAFLAPEQILPPMFLLFAYILAGMIWMGRARLRQTETSAGSGDMTSDEKWVLGGLMYYNPADPAVFVEKRTGLGYTFNMARPQGWLILLLILALAFLPILLPKLLH